MKKILLIAAAALISASAFAQTVSSANVVGYVKKDVTAGTFNIVAPQFLNAPTNGIALGDAFSGVADGSSVYTYDGGYVKYDYFAGFGWFQGFTPADAVLIEQGDAVWLKSGSATNVLMSGDIPASGSITNILAAGDFNLVANPYPVELALADIPTNSLSDNDSLYTYAGGYVKYDYFEGFGWFQGFTPADTVAIDVGAGFWLKSAAGGNLIFYKQY